MRAGTGGKNMLDFWGKNTAKLANLKSHKWQNGWDLCLGVEVWFLAVFLVEGWYNLSRLGIHHLGWWQLMIPVVTRESKIKCQYPPKMQECPLKRDHVKRKIVLQPSFFRGHVKFRGGKCTKRQFGWFQSLCCKKLFALWIYLVLVAQVLSKKYCLWLRSVNELRKRQFVPRFLDSILGGGYRIFVIFTPKLWVRRKTFWRFFNGWFNHHPISGLYFK